MPSGLKRRSWQNSLNGLPDTRCTTTLSSVKAVLL